MKVVIKTQALASVISFVSDKPAAIIKALGKSKFGKILVLAAEQGDDAFKATMIYLGNNEEFQETVMEIIGKEEDIPLSDLEDLLK